MSVLSVRVDDDLKSALEVEANKLGMTLSDYIKKSLKNGLFNTHISNTEKSLSGTKEPIKKLSEISDKAINEVEDKIKSIGEEAENNKYAKQFKKMYWILISIFILLTFISVPILLFSTKYFYILF